MNIVQVRANWLVMESVAYTSVQMLMLRWKLKYVKILWTNQTEREATWELESQMREKYPELFSFVINKETTLITITN